MSMMGGGGGDDDDGDDDGDDMMTDMTDLMIEKAKYLALVPVFFGAVSTIAGAKAVIGFIFALYTVLAIFFSLKFKSEKPEINKKPGPMPPSAAQFPSIPFAYAPQSVPHEYLYPNMPMQMPFNQWIYWIFLLTG